MLVDLDEEAERYYAPAPPELDPHGSELQTSLDGGHAAQLAFERSLPPKSKASNSVVFHAQYTEEFVDLDEDLDLPPRLAPNQPVTALQVARLLRRFANTQHTRSPAQNEELLGQVVALLDRIVVRAGVPIPPPSRSSTTTTSTTADEPELNERYAEHVVLRSNLPAGNKVINWRQLIEALAEVGKVDAALGLFESLEPRFRIIPNITLFLSVWKLCKDYHRTDKTLGYMDYFFSCRARSVGSDDWVSAATFNYILSAVRDVKVTLRVVDKMKKEKVELDAGSYEQIIFNMIKQGQINTALDYVKLMKSSGLQPTLNIYASLFNGLLHHPADPYYTNKGFRMVKGPRSEDDPPSDMSEHHHYSFSLMLKLFDDLKTLHKPNSEIYSQLLRACAQMGEYEKAFELFEELKQTCPVHFSHIGSLIAACGTNWQADRALELFWTMRDRHRVDPSPACLNALLVALVRSGRYDLLEPTMDRAYEAYQLCVWPKTVGYIIRSAVQLEDLEFSRGFLEMVAEKWPRTVDTKKVQGPVAVLEAKLAARHAAKEHHQVA